MDSIKKVFLNNNGLELWKNIIHLDNIENKKTFFKHHKRWMLLGLSINKDYVMIVLKIILAILTHSGYMVANAMYSTGMCGAKYHILHNRYSTTERKWKVYQQVGLSIVFSSLCYIIYSIRMFSINNMFHYPLELALLIAAYTFLEFFFVLRDYIRAKKKKDIETEQIKLMNIATLLIGIVLMQSAIMSSKGLKNMRPIAVSGIVFGWCAGCVGLYMIVKYLRNKRERQYG